MNQLVRITTLVAILLIGSAGLARADAAHEATQLSLRVVPAAAAVGQYIELQADLRTADGRPVVGQQIVFVAPGSWGDEIGGELTLGSARTDPTGTARLKYRPTVTGAATVEARYGGDDAYDPAEARFDLAIAGGTQQYTPTAGIRVPGLGVWLLVAVIATVWTLYFWVSTQVLRIALIGGPTTQPAQVADPGARANRRDFFRRLLVPAGLHAFTGLVGAGLATIVIRSPYTHSNLTDPKRLIGRYDRTPLIPVGDGEVRMRPLPPILARDVSFRREVLPTLKVNAGPHATPPKNSPPPHGVRLDSYASIMSRQGLVVPGDVEQSKLVGVLRDPAMRMPPSIGPLPEREYQIIISWIAQGAQDN